MSLRIGFFYCFLSISRLSRQSICVQNEYVHIIVIITKHKANIYLFFWSFVRLFFVAYCLVRSRITFTIIWWTCCADGRFGILLSCSLMWNHRTLKCVQCAYTIFCAKKCVMCRSADKCPPVLHFTVLHSTGRQWNIVLKESTKNEKRLQELKKKNSLQDNTYYNSIYETYIFCAFNKYVFIFIYVPRRHLTPLFVADWHIWSTQSNAYVLYFINILIL